MMNRLFLLSFLLSLTKALGNSVAVCTARSFSAAQSIPLEQLRTETHGLPVNVNLNLGDFPCSKGFRRQLASPKGATTIEFSSRRFLINLVISTAPGVSPCTHTVCATIGISTPSMDVTL